MIYIIFIVFFVILCGLGYFDYKLYKKLEEYKMDQDRKYTYYDKRMVEMEEYGYTDIRELNDYLIKVRKWAKERGVFDE